MKKFLRLFISIGICIVISISFVGCGTTTRNESNESAKVAESAATDVSSLKQKAIESYKTLLSGMYDANKGAEDSLYFFMRDLDADGIEELLVWAWPKMTAYTFDGALKNIGKQDFSPGTTRWMYSENASYPGIFSSNLGGGRVHYYYHSLEEGKFTEKALWNEDYSGITEALGLEHEEVIEFTEDKQLIEESKVVFEKNQELKFEKVNKKNLNKLK